MIRAFLNPLRSTAFGTKREFGRGISRPANRRIAAPRVRASVYCRILSGGLKFRETITEGIENAPAAFIGKLQGDNTGKQLVRMA